jgi:hypothetical protein
LEEGKREGAEERKRREAEGLALRCWLAIFIHVRDEVIQG